VTATYARAFISLAEIPHASFPRLLKPGRL
jgi:hypothetical protein